MHHLWTASELAVLDKVTTLKEATEFSMRKLQRMHTVGRSIVQVCGAMSSNEQATNEENMALIILAIEQARAHHVLVFDQTPLQGVTKRLTEHHAGEYDPTILTQVFDPLLETRLISTLLFLNNWTISRGAKHERARAMELGLIVGEYDMSWLTGHTLITAM